MPEDTLPALAEALASVRAPDELWARVERRIHERRPSGPHPLWAGAVALVTMLLLAALHPPGFPRFAAAVHRDLAGHPERLELRTASAAAVRAWVTATAQATPALAASVVLQLLGGRAVEYRGARYAAVAYRSGGHAATLLVGPARRADTPLPTLASRTADGLAVFTWYRDGRSYALVTSEADPARGACRICHL